VVTVASQGHRRGTLDFGDLGFEHGYAIMRAYQRSKLANVLFAAELARRLSRTGVTSNSLHPGVVATNIWSGAPIWARPLVAILYRPFMITPAEGGATIVQLAASPELEGVTGKYFEKQVAVAPAPLAQDEALAKRLWEVSGAMVGLPPDLPS
jgi:NAD(P)-dependent dehydrogenase (short-subunit alcohol dehydrogenase family)